jgi:hypothetical protein
LLFPLVLLAGGYWRALAAAAVMTVLLFAASWWAFGGASWEAFVHALPAASQASLTEGRADWLKLQSVYGLVRAIGGTDGLAWSAQIALAGAIAVLLIAMWRSKVAFELKAAALVAGTLLTTPYVFLYDLVALAVPVAFLLRAGAEQGEVPGETFGLAGACLLIVIFPFVKAPVGLAALLVVALLIARRVCSHPPRGSTHLGRTEPTGNNAAIAERSGKYSFCRLVPMVPKVVTIWFDEVSRKNFVGSLAQVSSNAEVASPSVLTCTVYTVMPAAFMLVQAIASRLSIDDWVVYQRSCVFKPSVSRMMISLY